MMKLITEFQYCHYLLARTFKCFRFGVIERFSCCNGNRYILWSRCHFSNTYRNSYCSVVLSRQRQQGINTLFDSSRSVFGVEFFKRRCKYATSSLTFDRWFKFFCRLMRWVGYKRRQLLIERYGRVLFVPFTGVGDTRREKEKKELGTIASGILTWSWNQVVVMMANLNVH